jgi:BirA family biotin operon repressor/biotin-[acetyl-CoA-carboxylase] ligase
VTSPPPARPPLDAARLAAADPDLLPGLTVEVVEEAPSTNALVTARAHEGAAEGLVVVAEHQTAGRGRLDRSWETPARSGLTFSLLLRPSVPLPSWPWLPLLAGYAVDKALKAAGFEASVKWPNDVLLDGRKLCGILIEVPSSAAGRVVIGVGLNVNNSLADAPPDVRQRATSLIDETNQPHDRTELLIGILRRLDRDLALLSVGAATALQSRWSEWCWLTGRTVGIDQGERLVEGLCEGIDTDGALLLRTPSGRERVYSGIVAAIGE